MLQSYQPFPTDEPSLLEPSRDDFDQQLRSVYDHRRRSHEGWVKEHTEKQKINQNDSRVRAEILVSEAWRIEKTHLDHQLVHAKHDVRELGKAAPPTAAQTPASEGPVVAIRPLPAGTPQRTATMDGDLEDTPALPRCACVGQPLHRRVTPKYRSLALLKRRFNSDSLEESMQTLRRAYDHDHEMLSDLIYSYGPEQQRICPRVLLQCVQERVDSCDSRWRCIGRSVRAEFAAGDAFATVIRNLSIMRIFLQGSQAAEYGCDSTERARRDALHQGVLDKLIEQDALFLAEDGGEEGEEGDFDLQMVDHGVGPTA